MKPRVAGSPGLREAKGCAKPREAKGYGMTGGDDGADRVRGDRSRPRAEREREREARLAAQLRANLVKRKAQARGLARAQAERGSVPDEQTE